MPLPSLRAASFDRLHRTGRLLLAGVVVTALTVLGLPDPSSAAVPPTAPGTFVISGAVATPMTLGVADLARMRQRTTTVTFQSGSRSESHVERGPLLLDVVALAGPKIDPSVKNGQLRLTVTVTAVDGYQVTYAYGELDPNFGGRPMLLSTEEDGASLAASGPRVVVPGDIRGGRYVSGVTRITVGVAPVADPAAPSTGALALRGDVKSPVTATFPQLSALATQTITVSFESGTTTETHTEQVAPLSSVLGAAGGIALDPTAKNGSLRTVVTATGTDGYQAVVSSGEADPTFGARAAYVSVAEDGASLAAKGPRLLIVGDKKGGRQVSLLSSLTVTTPQPGTDQPSNPDDRATALVAGDGGVFALGTAPFTGSANHLLAPGARAVGIARHPAGGYWVAASDGAVYAYGHSLFAGAANTTHLQAPIVAVAATPSGNGYLLAGRDGGVFAFGDAGFAGSAATLDLASPIVAISSTPSGRGYWLTGADGGVFAYGDATFFGSTAGFAATPTVALAPTPSGLGYWEAFANGTVKAFGDAAMLPDLSSQPLRAPVIAMHASPSGAGYRLITANGDTFSFGVAATGSLATLHLAAPVVGGW